MAGASWDLVISVQHQGDTAIGCDDPVSLGHVIDDQLG